MKIKDLYILPLMLIAAACSTNDEPAKPSSAYIMIGHTNKALDWSAEVRSRGGDDVSSRAGEGKLAAVVPDDMGVFGYNNLEPDGRRGVGQVFDNEHVYYKKGGAYGAFLQQHPNFVWEATDNDWPYAEPMPWQYSTATNPTRYRFYAYSPYQPTGVTLEDGTYRGFARMVWHNIPRYSAEDLMIADGLISYKSTISGRNEEQKVTMRHLMSRLRFCFKLGPKFSSLRKIRLREMKMVGISTYPLELRVIFSETDTYDADGNEKYNMALQWVDEATEEAYDVVLALDESIKDDGYLELSAANNTVFTPFASVYAHTGTALGSAKIEVLYDVVDLKGQLLRQNETATNEIALSFVCEGSTVEPGTHELMPGFYYDINITIEPSFLYVLSDNDYDNEGYLIISDK